MVFARSLQAVYFVQIAYSFGFAGDPISVKVPEFKQHPSSALHGQEEENRICLHESILDAQEGFDDDDEPMASFVEGTPQSQPFTSFAFAADTHADAGDYSPFEKKRRLH